MDFGLVMLLLISSFGGVIVYAAIDDFRLKHKKS